MTSKIKVDNISKVSDDSNIINKCGTAVNVGASGNTVTVTGNDIRSDNYKAADGGVIISQSGTAITIGASGDTVSLASGASQSGFGRSGSVEWQTTPKTATFTAADGEGYFINSGSAITMNLPAGSAGAIVAVSDYARNFATYNLTISPNGSEKIGGTAQDATLAVNGQAATFVYVDSTKGWVNVQNAEDTETGVSPYIEATGGTITTCGNDRIHTFTGPGTFCVSKIATASPAPANNQVSYMVVAGGAGGGAAHGGGGGAGGFREDKSPITPYTASPLEGSGTITVTATGFPITVGGGGAGAPCSSGAASGGVASSFSTITSAGGGGGGGEAPSPQGGQSGGSGGGGGAGAPVGSGNTPPVSPPQGSNGGPPAHSPPGYGSGGGGGATAVGGSGSPTQGGAGGAGATTGINGSNTAFAGGGGGSTYGGSSPGGAGGAGGGGNGTKQGGPAGTAGTANTGGGGGGGERGTSPTSGLAGGSGIVIIRYKFQ
tara:strand:+ start:1291 stop:2760 length:1470 start_codon:yes stop_codon:yes gene_type:complete